MSRTKTTTERDRQLDRDVALDPTVAEQSNDLDAPLRNVADVEDAEAARIKSAVERRTGQPLRDAHVRFLHRGGVRA